MNWVKGFFIGVGITASVVFLFRVATGWASKRSEGWWWR